MDLSRYDYIVFDCDGVILDSNRLKTEAFAVALKDEPEDAVQRLLDYHVENAGISRYRKFALFYEQILPAADADAKVASALRRFGDIVRRGMAECGYVPGALAFIEAAHRQGLKLFVASGSDEKELNEVFQERGISRFFEKILGSPSDKLENTRRIAELAGPGSKGVFFGDARSDAEAAEDSGLDFVFVKGASLWESGAAVAAQRGHLIINDFIL